MLIVSQNLTNYDIKLPENVIYRINLAWIDNLETLKNILDKHKNHSIFLDLPNQLRNHSFYDNISIIMFKISIFTCPSITFMYIKSIYLERVFFEYF